jgi:hypothetical protein
MEHPIKSQINFTVNILYLTSTGQGVRNMISIEPIGENGPVTASRHLKAANGFGRAFRQR